MSLSKDYTVSQINLLHSLHSQQSTWHPWIVQFTQRECINISKSIVNTFTMPVPRLLQSFGIILPFREWTKNSDFDVFFKGPTMNLARSQRETFSLFTLSASQLMQEQEISRLGCVVHRTANALITVSVAYVKVICSIMQMAALMMACTPAHWPTPLHTTASWRDLSH